VFITSDTSTDVSSHCIIHRGRPPRQVVSCVILNSCRCQLGSDLARTLTQVGMRPLRLALKCPPRRRVSAALVTHRRQVRPSSCAWCAKLVHLCKTRDDYPSELVSPIEPRPTWAPSQEHLAPEEEAPVAAGLYAPIQSLDSKWLRQNMI
jgi:hypothetical protein